MSLYSNVNNNQQLIAGISPVDQILNSTSKNAISNKTVYNALQDKVDKAVHDLIYYYDSSQVYTKTEVRELIGQINTLTIEVVSTLPTQDISTTTIYFVGPAAGTNTYDEYIYNNNAWAKIGDTSIDLTQYVSSANLTTILQSYYTKAEIDNLFNSYYTKTEVDQLLENVEIDVDDALSASSTNPVQNKVIKAKIDDIEDEIDTKQDKEFIGTTAQWNALTTEQKNQYQLVDLSDDGETSGVTFPTFTIDTDNITVGGTRTSNIFVERIGNVVNINVVAATVKRGGGTTALTAVTGLPKPVSPYCYMFLTATQDSFNVCALAQLDFYGNLDFYGVAVNKKYFGSLTYICE